MPTSKSANVTSTATSQAAGTTKGLDRKIAFHAAELDYTLPHKGKHRVWLAGIVAEYGKQIKELTYVFCTDAYLHQLNVEFLDHDTLTDIITFDYSEGVDGELLIGELYISVERVQDNAKDIDETWERELARVMAHGLLHLCGLGDKTEAEAKTMRAAEERALAAWGSVVGTK